MSSTALYKAFIEVGASEKAATEAAEDIIQVSQLPQLATKTDITSLKSDIAIGWKSRWLKWKPVLSNGWLALCSFLPASSSPASALSFKSCQPLVLSSNLRSNSGHP